MTSPTKAAEILQKRQTKAHYTFEQWLGCLDHAFLTLGFSRRVVQDTGADSWRDYYDHGYTAHGAMLEDLSHAW